MCVTREGRLEVICGRRRETAGQAWRAVADARWQGVQPHTQAENSLLSGAGGLDLCQREVKRTLFFSTFGSRSTSER